MNTQRERKRIKSIHYEIKTEEELAIFNWNKNDTGLNADAEVIRYILKKYYDQRKNDIKTQEAALEALKKGLVDLEEG